MDGHRNALSRVSRVVTRTPAATGDLSSPLYAPSSSPTHPPLRHSCRPASCCHSLVLLWHVGETGKALWVERRSQRYLHATMIRYVSGAYDV